MMGAAARQEREKKVTGFRDRLLADQLSTGRERAIHRDLKAMAAFLADSHVRVRDSVRAADLTQPRAGYIELTAHQEFALELYWASHWATNSNMPGWFRHWICAHPIFDAAFDILRFVLKEFEHLVMSPEEYEKLRQAAVTPGLVGNDGTNYGIAKYEQLDEYWMIAGLNYVLNLVHPKDVYPFQAPEISPVKMVAKDGKSEPVLGIIGDWGGGRYSEKGAHEPVPSPAERVRAALEQHGIDYLFHLGDTYYAGTDESRLGPNSAQEELKNLVDMWPDQGKGRNYTLNSNHEMYGAARGYFETALGQSHLFDQQQGASFFALEYPLKQAGKSWLVLGLDSAYYSDKENGVRMYMEGAIGSKKLFDCHKQQIKRIAGLCKGHQGPIMVMTHHNPCDTITAQTNKLYDQVAGAIGRAPTLWIWGHVHNCIVYDQMTVSAGAPPSPTKSRCCGHAAVPFGPAWGLRNKGLPYYARTHDDAFPVDVPRVYNGYALVQLHDDGTFTESYYEVRLPGEQGHLAWSCRWAAKDLVPA